MNILNPITDIKDRTTNQTPWTQLEFAFKKIQITKNQLFADLTKWNLTSRCKVKFQLTREKKENFPPTFSVEWIDFESGGYLHFIKNAKTHINFSH